MYLLCSPLEGTHRSEAPLGPLRFSRNDLCRFLLLPTCVRANDDRE